MPPKSLADLTRPPPTGELLPPPLPYATPRPRRHRVRRFGRAAVKVARKSVMECLGPGLITGASDDDPSGVATYSQAGAQYGFAMLWTTVFCLPLMAAIQEISARIGRTTGRGIAANLRKHYSNWIAFPIVLLLIVANTINIGADIGAMGAAMALVLPGRAHFYTVALAIISLALQIWLPYCKYSKVLKWMTLALFSYVGVVFAVHIHWRQALHDTLVPPIHWSPEYLALLVAVFGTTISPYLFFWQASMEAEELKAAPHEQALRVATVPETREQLRRIRLDTYVGMTFSNLIAFFMILTAAATLHQSGVRDVQTAQQAAEALRPIAGRFASLLFTLGIVGTGMLALPVLGGSAAYAMGELMKWPIGLERKPREAKGFYLILAAATVIGTAINFTRMDPIKALIWSAVINGIVAVPVMVVMMLMTHNPNVMGKLVRVSKQLRAVGWLATAAMLAAVIAMFVTLGK